MTPTQEFIKLGWTLLEHKCRYYEFSNPTITDYEYDQIEKRYEELAKELGLKPTAVDMVDFDMSRPSCREAYERVTSLRGK